MNNKIAALSLSVAVIGSAALGGSVTTLTHQEKEKELIQQIEEIQALPTPTPQIVFVTPAPTVPPKDEELVTPAPTASPKPIKEYHYVPVYVTPDYYLYIVQPGDTLGGIASMFHVPIYWLAEVNNIYNPDILEVGQEIRIPKD